MPNGIPSMPIFNPSQMVNAAMGEVNKAVTWALSPVNFAMGWFSQGVSNAIAIPGMAVSALTPRGGM